MTEAKSYLKLVIELFFLIGQVEYGVFALIVQASDSAIQQINHYTVDKYCIETDPLDSTIQPVNNQGLFFINYYIIFRHQTIPFGGCMVLLPLIKIVIITYYLFQLHKYGQKAE